MKKRRILRSERGFTLVELGIVMAIIAILAAVAYPTYTGMRERAYAAEAKAAMQEVRVEVWAWHLEKGTGWPADGTDLGWEAPTKQVGDWIISLDPAPKKTYTFTPVFEIVATKGTVKIYMGLDNNGVAEFFD